MPQLSAIEVFERVSSHLLIQNRRAGSMVASCMYRVPNTSLRCAVGCLIPDDKYSSDFEGISYVPISELEIGASAELALSLGRLISAVESEVGTGHTSLLRELQTIHDVSPPSEWSIKLQELRAAIDGGAAL